MYCIQAKGRRIRQMINRFQPARHVTPRKAKGSRYGGRIKGKRCCNSIQSELIGFFQVVLQVPKQKVHIFAVHQRIEVCNGKLNQRFNCLNLLQGYCHFLLFCSCSITMKKHQPNKEYSLHLLLEQPEYRSGLKKKTIHKFSVLFEFMKNMSEIALQ